VVGSGAAHHATRDSHVGIASSYCSKGYPCFRVPAVANKFDKFWNPICFTPTVARRNDKLSIFSFIPSLTKAFFLCTILKRFEKWSLSGLSKIHPSSQNLVAYPSPDQNLPHLKNSSLTFMSQTKKVSLHTFS
jgi:hypothetical protein